MSQEVEARSELSYPNFAQLYRTLMFDSQRSVSVPNHTVFTSSACAHKTTPERPAAKTQFKHLEAQNYESATDLLMYQHFTSDLTLTLSFTVYALLGPSHLSITWLLPPTPTTWLLPFCPKIIEQLDLSFPLR